MRVLRITQTWGWTPEALVEEARHAPPRVAERWQAVRLVWQGYPTAEVRAIVGRHPGGIRRYGRAWNALGPAGLVMGPAPGGRPKLSEAQTAALIAAVAQSPAAVGFGPAVNWDSKILQAYIEDQYGVRFSRGHLRKGLPQHGFSWTRPTSVLKRARPAEQAAFAERLAALKTTPPRTP